MTNLRHLHAQVNAHLRIDVTSVPNTRRRSTVGLALAGLAPATHVTVVVGDLFPSPDETRVIGELAAERQLVVDIEAGKYLEHWVAGAREAVESHPADVGRLR